MDQDQNIPTPPENAPALSNPPEAPEAPVAPEVTTPPVPKIEVTPEAIAERLGKTEAPASVAGDAPVAPRVPTFDAPPTVEEPAPAFDLTKLNPEQLIQLKAMLEGAPLRSVKKGNPVVKLRRLNGNIVLDFGNCVNTLRKDELTQITSEVVLIAVRFMDETGRPSMTIKDGKAVPKWDYVQYKDFMAAEQLKCEVVSKRSEEGSVIEGEVESNERPGVMVELEVKTVKDFFTVKLPVGSPVAQVELEGRIVNA